MNRQQKQEAKEKFIEALEMTNKQLSEIGADEIGQMESMIRYWEPDVNYTPREVTARQYEVKATLKARLNELNKSEPKPIIYLASKETLCDCGHYDEFPCTASFGTACWKCYDKMSG